MKDYDYYPDRQIKIRVKKEKPVKPVKPKKSPKKFWIGVLIYSGILIIMGGAALILLWNRLSKYQENLDASVKVSEYDVEVARAPQQFFEKYVDTNTVDSWLSIWKGENPDSFETDETISNIISEKFDLDKISLYKAPDYTDINPSYLIKNDGEEIAKVTLEGSNLAWSVKEASVYISGDLSKTITVPSDSNVHCNGILVDKSYVVSTSQNEDMADYADDMENPISYDKYEITGLIAEPLISVSGIRELINDEEGNYSYVLTGDSREKIVSDANDFVESLLYYFKMGKQDAETHMNSVLSHVVSSSKAAQVIRASYDGVIWTQAGKNVSYEITSKEPVVHADNCVSVDISYHSDDEDSVSLGISDGTYRVYFLDLGNGMKIYNFELK